MVETKDKGDYAMALINCPECNKQVSDNAKSCPDCGFPIRDYVDGLRPEKEEVGRKKRRIGVGNEKENLQKEKNV